MKLVPKIGIAFLGAGVVATLAIAAIVYFETRTDLENQVGSNQLVLTTNTMQSINRFLFERYSDIQAIGGLESLQETANNLSPEGTETQAKEKGDLINELHKLLAVTGPWNALTVVDSTGKAIVSSQEGVETGSAYFSQVWPTVSQGTVYYSDAITDVKDGKPVMVFAAPIHTGNNTDAPIAATVIGELNWQSVESIIGGTTGNWDLYSEKGVLIGSSNADEQKDLLKFDNSTKLASIMQGHTNGFEVMPSLEKNNTDTDLVSHAFQQAYHQFRGSNWLLTYSEVAEITFDHADLQAAIVTLSASGMLLFLLGIVLYIVVRIVIKPIRKLTTAVESIGAGNWDQRVQLDSGDELGGLAQSFNVMAGKVKEGILFTKQEKDRLTTVLESIGDGVFVLDEHRRIVMVNKSTEIISGFERAELINQAYNQKLKFIFERDGQENSAFVNKVYEEGSKAEMSNHTLLIRKDETQVAVADSAAPIKGEGGKVIGCVVVFRDVSDERRVEKMKDQFISLSSHQLRTPLTAAKWISKRLLSEKTGSLNEEQVGLAKDIEESIDRLIVLVNDLLDVSRIESGRVDVNPVPVDVPDLVRTLVHELSGIFESRSQNIQVSADEQVPLVTLDPKLMRQVVLNLLSNAAKYTPVKGLIKAAVHVKDSEVIIEIADGGIGIPKSEQKHVYERFFRAGNVSGIGNEEGTGLGLYLVKAIVELSGGRIWFESEEGKGTTFWVALPLQGSAPKKGELIV